MAKDPKNRKKILKEQLENTLERLDEAQETMVHDNISEEEKEAIARKNRHREEQIAGLKSELAEYEDQ